jgi:hypothetical protein
MTSHPHRAPRLDMDKATALPTLCASNDILRDDIHLHKHSVISNGGQNMKIRVLKDDKKSPRGKKWLTICART